jgi:hypothetical protein
MCSSVALASGGLRQGRIRPSGQAAPSAQSRDSRPTTTHLVHRGVGLAIAFLLLAIAALAFDVATSDLSIKGELR